MLPDGWKNLSGGLPRAADESDSSEWYSGGLQFSCTQCGNCCTGPPGAVWFTKEEGSALARTVGLDEQSFYEKYARRIGRRWSLIERKTEHGYDCVFLDRRSAPGKAICSVYEARPKQCRIWPFWPENLESRESWERVKRETPCPGMNCGKLIPIESIRVQRKEMEAS